MTYQNPYLTKAPRPLFVARAEAAENRANTLAWLAMFEPDYKSNPGKITREHDDLIRELETDAYRALFDKLNAATA